MSKRLMILICVVLAAATLAGCGKYRPNDTAKDIARAQLVNASCKSGVDFTKEFYGDWKVNCMDGSQALVTYGQIEARAEANHFAATNTDRNQDQ